jgi:hypothetical protein
LYKTLLKPVLTYGGKGSKLTGIIEKKKGASKDIWPSVGEWVLEYKI